MTKVAPIAPVAPGRLSITNGWPSLSLSGCASTRAMVSDDPPAGNGTTIVTAFCGQAVPAATATLLTVAPTARATNTPAIRRNSVFCFSIVLSPV
ncbi:hypothetical protein D3C72_1613930 [compost metagenome]